MRSVEVEAQELKNWPADSVVTEFTKGVTAPITTFLIATNKRACVVIDFDVKNGKESARWRRSGKVAHGWWRRGTILGCVETVEGVERSGDGGGGGSAARKIVVEVDNSTAGAGIDLGNREQQGAVSGKDKPEVSSFGFGVSVVLPIRAGKLGLTSNILRGHPIACPATTAVAWMPAFGPQGELEAGATGVVACWKAALRACPRTTGSAGRWWMQNDPVVRCRIERPERTSST